MLPGRQKSQIERNREHVREILPKAVSFSVLEQKKINFTMSHVNAGIRQSPPDHTPGDVFKFIHSEGVTVKYYIV